MPLPLDKLGVEYPEKVATIDAARARAYAAATNDDNDAYTSGRLVPPVFAVVPAFEVVGEVGAEVIPPENLLSLVHGEQDIHLHRPLVPGMTLHSRATMHSVRAGGSGTRLITRVVSTDDAGELVAEQFFTIFLRGLTDATSAGPDKPDHDFPEDVRGTPVGEVTIHVDDDQTFRYRDASGDMNPIHVDDEIARSVGLPGKILHGLCTMAMTSQAVITTVAGGDPARLRRLAVRFAANVLPGNDVVTTIYDAGGADGRTHYAFEATSAGATVIKNGWAEVGAPVPG
ncbi:MAG: Peroxisomal multifunctional enzyme type 2 [Acidimicrobiales bacterium]|jgi:acyl dehydratase|nr:Peroxisomal multifunctional enzyme type 2 [Acidimicrobiales bacterium]